MEAKLRITICLQNCLPFHFFLQNSIRQFLFKFIGSKILTSNWPTVWLNLEHSSQKIEHNQAYFHMESFVSILVKKILTSNWTTVWLNLEHSSQDLEHNQSYFHMDSSVSSTCFLKTIINTRCMHDYISFCISTSVLPSQLFKVGGSCKQAKVFHLTLKSLAWISLTLTFVL